MEQLKSLSPYLVGGALVLSPIVYFLHRRLSGTKWSPARPPCPPNTVLLYQSVRGPYAPSLSPFPLKLELYLRMAKIPYINDFSTQFSSKGKTPWMTYNGVDVADSQFCIEYLNKNLGIDLNKKLSKEEKAVAKALQVMVDEHLYWPLVYYRWVYDDKQTMTRLGFGRMFSQIEYLREVIVKQLHCQGIGRHTSEEIKHITVSDLQALSDFLGEKDYMMGSEATEVDCAVFGHVAQFVWQCKDGFSEKLVPERFPNLASYCERIKNRFWPDWDECITHGATREATK